MSSCQSNQIKKRMDEDSNSPRSFLKSKVIPFVYKHFLMLGILLALLIGFVLPKAGAWVGGFEGSSFICVICVFLHSGLKLRTAELKSVLKEYKAFLWGLISIVLLSSVIGAKLSQLLPFGETVSNHKDGNGNITSIAGIAGPREFLLGLEIYFISPCAVASSIVLTSLAGGDVTLALLLTVTTNTLGVVIVPLLAKWLVSVKDIQINVVNLLVKLVLTVPVPLLIGKALTRIDYVKDFVEKHTKVLKIISLTFLICIPWMKISKAQLTGAFQDVSVISLIIMFFWGLALHIVFLIMNYISSWILRFELEVRKTLVIMASMKTLAVTLSVITFLPVQFGDPGLMSLPLIIIHLSLILIDSVWVVHWNTDESQDEAIEDDSCSTYSNKECTSRHIIHVTSV